MTTITKTTTLLAKPVPAVTKAYPTTNPEAVGKYIPDEGETLEGAHLDGASVRVECRTMEDEPLDRDIPAEEMTLTDSRIVIRGETGTAFGTCTEAADSSRPFKLIVTTSAGSTELDLAIA